MSRIEACRAWAKLQSLAKQILARVCSQLNSHEAGKSDIGNVMGGIPEQDAALNSPKVPEFMEWSWLVTSLHI
jgi:hypothetical protein